MKEIAELTSSEYGAFGLFSEDGRLQEFYTCGIDNEQIKKI